MSRYVVKVGGHALDEISGTHAVLVALAQDVIALRASGHQVVVVHGGGPQIAALLARVGLPSRFHEGLRVTDGATMDCVAMALCLVNVQLVAALGVAGLHVVGLNGADDQLFLSESLGEPWGRAGVAPRVRAQAVEVALAAGLTPVVSPLALDGDGALLNCNADTAAGALAGALDADLLVLLSDVAQLRGDPDDPASALDVVTRVDAERLLEEHAAREGMRPKLRAALDALDGGAARVVVANGTTPHALVDVLAGSAAMTEVVR